MSDKQTQYISAIVSGVNSLFDDESHLKQYNWEEIDFTQFMTAYVKAGNYIFNKMTDINKNNLEFTHLANQLIVQDMMKDEEETFGID